MDIPNKSIQLLAFLTLGDSIALAGGKKNPVTSDVVELGLRILHPVLIQGLEIDERKQEGQLMLNRWQTHEAEKGVPFNCLLAEFAEWSERGQLHRNSASPFPGGEVALLEVVAHCVRLVPKWGAEGKVPKLFRMIQMQGNPLIGLAQHDIKAGAHLGNVEYRPEAELLKFLRRL